MYTYTLHGEITRTYELSLSQLQGIYTCCMLQGTRKSIIPTQRLVLENITSRSDISGGSDRPITKYNPYPLTVEQLDSSYNSAIAYPFEYLRNWTLDHKNYLPRIWNPEYAVESVGIDGIYKLGISIDSVYIMDLITDNVSEYLSGILFADMILGFYSTYYIHELTRYGFDECRNVYGYCIHTPHTSETQMPLRTISFSGLDGFRLFDLPRRISGAIIYESACSWQSISKYLRSISLPSLACNNKIPNRHNKLIDTLNKKSLTTEDRNYIINYIDCGEDLLDIAAYVTDPEIMKIYTSKRIDKDTKLFEVAMLNPPYLSYLLQNYNFSIGPEPKWLTELSGVWIDKLPNGDRRLVDSVVVLLIDGREQVSQELMEKILMHVEYPEVILELLRDARIAPSINRMKLYGSILRNIESYKHSVLPWLLSNITLPQDYMISLARTLLRMEWNDDNDISILREIIPKVYNNIPGDILGSMMYDVLNLFNKQQTDKHTHDQRIASMFGREILNNRNSVIPNDVVQYILSLEPYYGNRNLYYIRILRALQRRMRNQ